MNDYRAMLERDRSADEHFTDTPTIVALLVILFLILGVFKGTFFSLLVVSILVLIILQIKRTRRASKSKEMF